jgi:hypothetical protein
MAVVSEYSMIALAAGSHKGTSVLIVGSEAPNDSKEYARGLLLLVTERRQDATSLKI